MWLPRSSSPPAPMDVLMGLVAECLQRWRIAANPMGAPTVVLAVAMLSTLAIAGCSERSTAPPLEYDDQQAQQLRQVLDEFPLEEDE